MTQRLECEGAEIEAGEKVRRANQAVLQRIEQDWCAAQLSLVQYRRLEGSAVNAVNEGLLLCFSPYGDPGTLPVRLNGSVQPACQIKPGTMHVLPPGTLFESNSPLSTRATTYLNITFPVALLEEFAAEHSLVDLEPNFDFDNPFIRLLCEQLLQRMRAGDASNMYREAASRFVLASLLDALDARRRPPASGGLASWQLRRVCDFLIEHIAEEISLPQLAAIAELSPFHFCRAFKQSTGLPPHAWLIARRVEEAQKLMCEHPEMGLTEIALCVGYQSQAAFGVAFKRATGATPGRWRRERGA